MSEQLLSFRKAAEITGKHAKELQRAERDGALKKTTIGNKTGFSRADLRRWLLARSDRFIDRAAEEMAKADALLDGQ